MHYTTETNRTSAPALKDISHNSASGPHFIPDAERSQRLCLSAKEMMADNPGQAVQCLVQALLQRPSNMLAYQLLSEHYEASDRFDDAALCRKSILPADALQLPGHKEDQARDSRSDEGQLSQMIERHTLYPEERIPLMPPGGVHTGVNNSPRPAFFDQQAIMAESCFIDRLEGGVLWHDSFHTRVFTSQHEEVLEHQKADLPLINSLMARHEPHHLEGRMFLIGARGAHNFYHWLADIAPKLGVLLRSGYRFNDSDRFVVAFSNQEFTWQIMAQFGVRPEQVIESEKHTPYLCADELVVPYVANKMGLTMGRRVPQVMREHFLPTPEIKGHRRLFIARESQTADGRQIENQNRLLSLLLKFGFESVNPEKLPVVQQAILFAEAEVVIAAHGAALGNLMFCRDSTKVVEFYAGHLAPCYWAISALCQLEYYQVFCGQSDGSADKHDASGQGNSARRSGNLTVPLAEFEPLLEQLISSSSS